MLKLFIAPGACSLAVHIALRESGLPFEVEAVDLAAKKTSTGEDFLAVAPKGKVPALALDDGSVLTEVAAVLQYVADHSASPLAPAPGTLERYRLQEWLSFIGAELHKAFTPLFRPDTPEDYVSVAIRNVSQAFDYLDARIKGGGPYLMGPTFSVADSYCFTVASWSAHRDISLDPWPALSDYVARVASRPAVREALRAEGLSG